MIDKTYRDVKEGGDSLIPEKGLFRHLASEERLLLQKNATRMQFVRHDIILRQMMPSDHVVFVLSGIVKIYKSGRSKRVTCIGLAGPGQLAGMPCAFGFPEYRFSVSAVESTDALLIRSDALVSLIETNGDFAKEMLVMMSRDIVDLAYKLVSLTFKQLPGRVADLIRYFSRDVFDSDEFTVPLTRQELAELIGTTKESLIRTLHEFRNDKLIEMEGRRIKIIAPELIDILCELG